MPQRTLGTLEEKTNETRYIALIALLAPSLVLCMLPLPGNPGDGHTLAPALVQAERISGTA